ncbi:hypothetical protein BDN72DRAFT_132078 [Pluteus cervinus]|uniref:Uncharacterized protein n=1 Tax=Pluteus cervinus TaxID=181527 RepID=A0ACD3AM46_9AGAR|nr:hypothetical protein BDN72DRAFT_132078 [Pluteus cervinus]
MTYLFKIPHWVLPLVILLGGSVSLLLCNISPPFTESTLLFTLNGSSGPIWFGIWGYCYPSFLVGTCTPSSLGYVMGDVVTNSLGTDVLAHSVSRAHTGALVLYPIATVLTYASFSASLFFLVSRTATKEYTRPSTLTAVLALGVITMIVTFAALSISFSLGATVMGQAQTVDNVTFQWGNIVWLTAIAFCTQVYNCQRILSLRASLQNYMPGTKAFSEAKL